MDIPAEDFQTGTAAWSDVGFEVDIAAVVDAESGRSEECCAAPCVDMKQRAVVAHVVPERNIGIAADDHPTGGLIRHVAKDTGLSVGQRQIAFVREPRSAEDQGASARAIASNLRIIIRC